ncbi:hypothetical protein FOA52_009717 [Chlamydomonas sp. UWO 241]|nr:hypothetical protein FOA52_009717 [Chlamydomonas sp. UWO 241]
MSEGKAFRHVNPQRPPMADVPRSPTRAEWPCKQPGGRTSSAAGWPESRAWMVWAAGELARDLVGVSAHTSRAAVETVAVLDSHLTTGRGSLDALDTVLQLHGRHLHLPGIEANGKLRLSLKTVGGRDELCVSELAWEELCAGEALADFSAAAQAPLASALACRVNDVMFDVERKWSYMSMDADFCA